jgi:hypothetical protein
MGRSAHSDHRTRACGRLRLFSGQPRAHVERDGGGPQRVRDWAVAADSSAQQTIDAPSVGDSISARVATTAAWRAEIGGYELSPPRTSSMNASTSPIRRTG